MNWFNEIVGYIGMLFIVSSFFFKSIKTLRILNTIGGCFCLVYGAITATYATVALNAVCMIINIIQILRLSKKSK